MTTIDVWSDFVCPWCYLGKRRLERAIADVGAEVELHWRSFQLDPHAPRFGAPGAGDLTEEYLASRVGGIERAREMQRSLTDLAAADGLAYRLDLTRHVNTFDAHRLQHEAAAQGLGDELAERLFSAQLVAGERIDDLTVLARLAAEVGLDVDTTTRVLGDPEVHREAVEADVREARELGANGVPFFVLDRRLGVSGAQPLETFVAALEQARRTAA